MSGQDVAAALLAAARTGEPIYVVGRRYVSVDAGQVVIDPEDAAQVARLCRGLVEAMYHAGDKASAANGVHPATVAAALREFAAPTEPEPTVSPAEARAMRTALARLDREEARR